MIDLGLPYWEHIGLALDLICIFLGILALSGLGLLGTAVYRNKLLKSRQK